MQTFVTDFSDYDVFLEKSSTSRLIEPKIHTVGFKKYQYKQQMSKRFNTVSKSLVTLVA